MSDERLSEVTRSVSLLARWRPTLTVSDWFPDDMEEDEDPELEPPTAPCTDKLQRLSGPIVYGRMCGVRLRTASRCSLALLFPDDDAEGEDDDAEVVAAIAMVPAEEEVVEKGGEEESWWWWRWWDWG